MAAKFEVRSPKAGQYVWVLTSQGRTLATSEPYRRRKLAEDAIVAFRMTAVNAPVVDTTRPAATTPTGAAARVVGRAVGKAVMTGGQAVETVEEAAAKTAKRAAKKAARAVKTVAKAAKPQEARTGKKSGKRR